MKLKTSMLIALLLAFSFVHSQNFSDSYAFDDKDIVLERAQTKLDVLMAKYPFPEKHKEVILQPYYENYEFGRSFIKRIYTKDLPEQSRKLDSAKLKYQLWKEAQIDYIKPIKKQWGNLMKRHAFDNTYKETYIDYHFYKNYAIDDTYAQIDFEKLKNNIKLALFTTELAEAEVNYVFSTCDFDKLDSLRLQYGRAKLSRYIDSLTNQKLHTNEDVFLERNTSFYCNYVRNNVKKAEKKVAKKKGAYQDSVFIAQAKHIDLSDEKINAILTLITRRNSDLKSLKNRQQDAEGSMAELFDNTAVKSKSEIKKDFARNLTEIIDRKQFGELFGGLFAKNMEKNARGTLENLFTSYEFKDEQKVAVSALVIDYNKNKEIIKAYYYYDTKLKKQKMSSLNYVFNKEFKKLMASYKIPYEGVKSIRKKYTWE